MRRLLCLLPLLLCVWITPAMSQPLAFPTAEGFGRFASGGRGGSVCKVTRLADDSSPGSLRYCLTQTGNRTVVFTTGGTMDFHTNLINVASDVHIACQTAPGDGVLLKGELKFYGTTNFIVRYCRIRPGDDPAPTNAITGHVNDVDSVPTAYSGIYDHISIGTANDDTFFHYGPGPADSSITIQHSIMSEGLLWDGSSSATFGVGTGGTIHNQVSLLHNLILGFSKRCPVMAGGRLQMVNNLCQHLGEEGTYLIPQFGPLEVNIVNNSFRTRNNDQTLINIGGCGWSTWGATNGVGNCKTAYDNASNIYIHGNIHSMRRTSAASGSETAMVAIYSGTNILNTKIQSTTPVAGFPTIATQHTAAEVRQYIMDNAGATYPMRDSFDTRVMNDVLNEPPTGRICGLYGTAESVCKSFGTYAAGTAPLDSDNDGMPNSYETANGLNPNSAADGAAIISGGPNNGYSNLEVYLNQIVGGPPIEPEPCGCTPCPCPPTLGEISVCMASHTFGASPSTANCASSFGTPTAALVLSSMAVTSGETGTNARFSVGATDGTNQYTQAIADVGASAPDALARRRYATTRTVTFITETGALDGDYSATGGGTFGNDAVTFTSTDVVTTPAKAEVVMFGGTDLAVKVGTFVSHATSGQAVDVTSVGFLADLVLVFGNRGNYTLNTSAATAFSCVGAAIQVGGVVTQASLVQYQGDGAAAALLGVTVDDRYACTSTSTTPGSSVALSAFDAQGFTATTAQESQAHTYGYLAFKFNGTKIPFLQVINTPTAPGVAATTLTGLVPEFGLLLMSLAQAVRTTEVDSDANGFAVGVFTASRASTVGVVSEDAAATMQSLSFVDGTALRLHSLTGTISHEATVAGMTANTLSLNYTVAASPARKWILVGWGAPPQVTSLVQRKRIWAW